jgi:PAS domain S-box-containing protein
VDRTLRTLHLEDDPRDAEIVRDMLEAGGVACDITRVQTREDFAASLEKGRWDLILADYLLPSFDGMLALKIAAQRSPHVPFIFVSGVMGEELAIEALKLGATDYVLKERLSRIVSSVRGAVREAKHHAERKRAEYLTRQMFESAPDGVAVVGTDYRYRRVNPVYERNWKMPAEKIVGMHVADLLGADMFAHTSKPNLDRCFAGEQVSFAEWVTNALGRFYLSVSCTPLRLDSERVEAALVITRDLTEHMLASEALREAQGALARVNRVTTLGVLAASIAHEVNQPLGAMVTSAASCLRWLAAQPPDFDKAQRALERIAKDGRRASEVIDRIRTLVQRQAPRRDRVDVNDAILEVIALTRDETRRNEVWLETSLAHGLPPVSGDRVQLQQVILNLAVNAIEAMSAIGDRGRELAIRSAKDGGALLVEVRDSGPGVDPEHAEQLFEAFYTTNADGIGMGLSISRSIIEAHGGRMWASRNQPHGAVFRFSLPLEAL